jgi:hypothetical protein
MHHPKNNWRQQTLLLWREIAPKTLRATLAIVNADDEEH